MGADAIVSHTRGDTARWSGPHYEASAYRLDDRVRYDGSHHAAQLLFQNQVLGGVGLDEGCWI